ncbi:MAG: SAM-dependent methyltransferase [Treponemataceae bacterium]|nr:SAM-dependent methyltransferase [Treponemataceae bacterium]
MIISAVLSKPAKSCGEQLGRPYQRIKIRAGHSAAGAYFVELFTKTQVFHEHKTEEALKQFLEANAGKTFKNCVIRTDAEEITVLANKKGEISVLRKKAARPAAESDGGGSASKNHLLPEGIPVPFLVLLGIMTPEGKVVSSKYDKFRQINRFLEFIDDILPRVMEAASGRPLRIVDFGCGKSYLTFAAHHFLTEVKRLDAEIVGLDVKQDVIDYCNKTARQLHCKGLSFAIGSIAEYQQENPPDIVIALHACDTATDFALDYAVRNQCRAILSVPCCQHELNGQLDALRKEIRRKQGGGVPLSHDEQLFAPLLKHGIIKERFASLATDALRAEALERAGYSVQLLEFIDMEHTPKNILIRAVRNVSEGGGTPGGDTDADGAQELVSALGITPTLRRLLQEL